MAAPLVLATAGCGGSAPPPWTASFDTLPNGAILVTNTARAAGDTSGQWSVTEDLRLGEIDGPPERTFAEVTHVGVDGADRLYVLERQSHEIRVFEPQGDYVRTIGGTGEGPGEFRVAYGMRFDPQGRLWVADSRLRRFTVFDTAGNVLSTHRREVLCFGYTWHGIIDSDGRVLDDGCVLGERRDDKPRSVLLVLDTTTDRYTDTITVPAPATDPPVYDFRDSRGIGTVMSVPFAPGFVRTLDPRGFFWMGTNDRYRLHQVSFAGDTVRIIDRDAPAVPITSAERDSALAPVRRQAGSQPVDPSLVPHTKPRFQRIVIDDRGFVWVQRPVPAGASGALFDVFDREGRLVAEVRTPFIPYAYATVTLVRDHMYAVVRDELDVPFIVRARVRRGPP